MQDLGKFKGCAYVKFDYDPYKTYWVYLYSLEEKVLTAGTNFGYSTTTYAMMGNYAGVCIPKGDIRFSESENFFYLPLYTPITLTCP